MYAHAARRARSYVVVCGWGWCRFQKLDALKLTATTTLNSAPEALFISTPVH